MFSRLHCNSLFDTDVTLALQRPIDITLDRLNLDPGNMNKIFHYSWKEHLKVSKISFEVWGML